MTFRLRLESSLDTDYFKIIGFAGHDHPSKCQFKYGICEHLFSGANIILNILHQTNMNASLVRDVPV